jgi:hypothetical protein
MERLGHDRYVEMTFRGGTMSALRFVCIGSLLLGLVGASGPHRAEAEVFDQPRYAILVAVQDYSHTSGLNAPNQDVCALWRVLTTVGGFRKENILIFAAPRSWSCGGGDPPLSPTHGEIATHVARWQKRFEPDALVLFVFSGHGVSHAGKSYLLAQDSTLTSKGPGDALDVERILELLAPPGSTQRKLVVMLDACRDLAAAAKAPGPEYVRNLSDATRSLERNSPGISGAVLYSASAGEKSYARVTSPVSYFTWAVVKGLLGEAADTKGSVRLGDLADYVKNEVPQLIRYDFFRRQTLKQSPALVPIGSAWEDLRMALIPPQPRKFFYSLEVFISPMSREGKRLGLEQAFDMVSPRPDAFLDETLPFKVTTLTPLETIRVPYQTGSGGTTVDYLVRITFHYGRAHRAFILCPRSPEIPKGALRPAVKVSALEGTLTIDARGAFAEWGHCLRDPEACFRSDDGEPPREYTTLTQCLPE